MTATTNHGRVVTYNEELRSVKSPDPLITWPFKVTWRIKYVVSLLLQGLWPSNLAKW